MSDSVTVTRTIAASAETLWDMVADLPEMGRWSPENTGGHWKGDVTGPVVGAKFVGTNANESKKWSTTATIVTADRPHAVAWDVVVGPFKIARWDYRFDVVDEGTLVTETWTDHRNGLARWLGGIASKVSDRAAHNRVNMEETLRNLAQAAESPAG